MSPKETNFIESLQHEGIFLTAMREDLKRHAVEFFSREACKEIQMN